MPSIPDDWKKAIVTITPGFETTGDPYLGVSGDFDGMGISCGVLQWNIGSGSLQPMVKAVGKPHVVSSMPIFGGDLWNACNGSISAGLAIVRGWQVNNALKPKPKAELKALLGTPAMRAEQDQRIDAVAQLALAKATAWAASQGGAAPSKRLFCWFFDLVTQNGGLEGLTPQDVVDFIAANTPERADDLICDFMAGQSGSSGHVKDAHKNADLWRNQADAEKLDLLAMTYLRSKTSNPKWRHVVINRKGAIAMGKGWVNSGKFDFASHGL